MHWIEVNTEKDMKKLLEVFGGFHDGCLREMHLWNSYFIDEDLCMGSGEGNLNAKVIFQRQLESPSAIEVYFTQVQRMNIVSTPSNYWYSIFEATLSYKDGLYYWSDEDNFNIDSPTNEAMWISSKGIKWRNRSEWMGEELRYGCRE